MNQVKTESRIDKDTVLKLDKVTKIFGGLNACSSVSFEIHKGEVVGLIGPNGAGKTTLFNIISCVYNPDAGDLYIYDDSKEEGSREICLNHLKPYKATQYGIARTFQNIRLFKTRTVIDNVKIAMHKDSHLPLIDSLLRTKKHYKVEEEMEEKALALLDIFNLKDKAYELATSLAYGEQRLLEIARALALNPKILFLDEPAAGMNPFETHELTLMIDKIKELFDITVVLIEHDMSLVMSMCEKIYVLEHGVLIASGTPDEIKNNKRVIRAYLGEEV